MSHAKPRRTQRLLGALVAAAVAFGGAVVAPTQAFAADNGTVAGATFDWGVKDSFRKYIHTGSAKGDSAVIGAVTKDAEMGEPGKAYHWVAGAGTGATDGSAADVQFEGGVHFTGHDGLLDVKLQRPRVEITSATTGKLYLDTVSKGLDGAPTVTQQGVHFADLTLPAAAVAKTDDGATVSFTGVDAVLTEEGSKGFAGFYKGGTKLEGVFNLSLPVTVKPLATTAVIDTRTTEFVAGTNIGAAVKVTAEDGAVLSDEHGTVELFFDGESAGQARYIAQAQMFALNLPGTDKLGKHSITAKFTPKDAKAFAAATATAVEITVVAEKQPENPGGGESEAPKYTPAVQLFKADGVTALGDAEVREGDTIVVKGTGLNPNNVGGRGVPVPKDQAQGYYVAFGQFAAEWQPSKGDATKEARPTEAAAWAMGDAAFAAIPDKYKPSVEKDRIVLDEKGNFTWTLKLPAIAKGVKDGKPGIYVYPASSLVDASHELMLALNYKAEAPKAEEPKAEAPKTETPKTDVKPVPNQPAPQAPADECVAYGVAGGSFNWGFRESFRNYVQGRIAKGTFSGGAFTATGGAVNVKEGIGLINFSGSIHATGHNGILNYNLVNPSIQLTGGNSGVLYATVNGSRIAYANLHFSGLSVTEHGVTASSVAATLTAAGAQTFTYNGTEFYKAGEALDSFSLNVTLGGKVSCADAPAADPKAAKKLAATGADAAPLGAVSMLLLAGAVAAAAGRRTRKTTR